MTETIEIDHDILSRNEEPDLTLAEKVEQLQDRVADLEDELESINRRNDEYTYQLEGF